MSLRVAAYLIVALLFCAVVFSLAGYSSWSILLNVARGALFSPGAIVHTLRWMIPLFITALGVVVSFRCGYFNIGAQGQFYLGAIFGAFVVDRFRGGAPLLIIPLSLFAGVLGGVCWALWPAWLRIRYGTDEVITTLMGNFIAGFLLLYVTSNVLKDSSGSGQVSASRPVESSLRLSTASGVSLPIMLLAVALGVLIWLLLHRTAFGVLSGLAGRNPTMILWQGAPASQLGYLSFALSGGLAGVAGAVELLGPDGRLVSGFEPSVGFSALLIALVANLLVPATVVAALFFGGLAAAGLYLPVVAGLPAAAIDFINASITLLITARAWPHNVLARLRFLKTVSND